MQLEKNSNNDKQMSQSTNWVLKQKWGTSACSTAPCSSTIRRSSSLLSVLGIFPTYNLRGATDTGSASTDVCSATAATLLSSLEFKPRCKTENWVEIGGWRSELRVRTERLASCGCWVAKRFVGWGWNRFGERMEEIVAISGEVVGSVFGNWRDWDSITQLTRIAER